MYNTMKFHLFFLRMALLLTIALAFTLESKSAGKPFFKENFSNIGENGLPVGWEAWKPKNMEMLFETADLPVFQGGMSYRLSGSGKYHAKGSIMKTVGGFTEGAYYKFTVYFATEGLTQSINTRILPVIKWGQGKNIKHIVPVEKTGDWFRAELILQVTKDMAGEITLELFAGWIPEGSVFWGEVRIDELEEYLPEKRLVNVAVIDKAPPKGCSLMESCDFHVSQIDNACKGSQPDVICLTETFNSFRVEPTDEWANAVSMDSEYMMKIKDAARRNKVNLVGSILENDNGILFNTGFLINRQGELVDRYRKAQLAMTEVLYSSRSRGDELKVIEADFGKIGIAICWDYQFPEFNRLLAFKGAEIIFVPIAADIRLTEDGVKTGMEHVGKTITIENRIPVVFAKRASWQNGPSYIIDSYGKVVAQSDDNNPSLSATLCINSKHYMWTGSEYIKAYYSSRRPELYKELVSDTTALYKSGIR